MELIFDNTTALPREPAHETNSGTHSLHTDRVQKPPKNRAAVNSHRGPIMQSFLCHTLSSVRTVIKPLEPYSAPN
ncbi:uncharacterized protein METZ01_LOCUS353098, partial [marine metagenome]